MKNKLMKLGSVLITVMLTVLILGKLTNLMEYKSSQKKYNDFFNQSEDFDVLFAGTSHVINGIFPMELWNDYGIVSYNLGGHANGIATTYWTVMNALDYTTPKVVVVDCYGISKNTKTWPNYSYLHMNFDRYPLSLTKIRTIWDLYDDPVLIEGIERGEIIPESDEPRTRLGLLWSYSVYHSRWDSINEQDFDVYEENEKGASLKDEVSKVDDFPKLNGEKMTGRTVALEYLDRIIEDCQKRNIDVILTYLPFPAADKNQREANFLYDYAADKGVTYFNFLDMDIVDFETDMADQFSHLNPVGAAKVTDYIGRYLIENYGDDINHKDDPRYYFWYDDYEDCMNDREYAMSFVSDFKIYLMYMNFLRMEGVIDIRDKSVFEDKQIVSMFEELGISGENISEETDFIVLRKNQSPIVLNSIRSFGEHLSTEMGEFSYYSSEEGPYGLYLNGEEYYTSDVNLNCAIGTKVLKHNGDETRTEFEIQSDAESGINKFVKRKSTN